MLDVGCCVCGSEEYFQERSSTSSQTEDTVRYLPCDMDLQRLLFLLADCLEAMLSTWLMYQRAEFGKTEGLEGSRSICNTALIGAHVQDARLEELLQERLNPNQQARQMAV